MINTNVSILLIFRNEKNRIRSNSPPSGRASSPTSTSGGYVKLYMLVVLVYSLCTFQYYREHCEKTGSFHFDCCMYTNLYFFYLRWKYNDEYDQD